MPLRKLGLFAQRAGKVFVSVTTWARLVREHGWRAYTFQLVEIAVWIAKYVSARETLYRNAARRPRPT